MNERTKEPLDGSERGEWKEDQMVSLIISFKYWRRKQEYLSENRSQPNAQHIRGSYD